MKIAAALVKRTTQICFLHRRRRQLPAASKRTTICGSVSIGVSVCKTNNNQTTPTLTPTPKTAATKRTRHLLTHLKRVKPINVSLYPKKKLNMKFIIHLYFLNHFKVRKRCTVLYCKLTNDTSFQSNQTARSVPFTCI